MNAIKACADAPYAEIKEQLGGCYLIEAESLDAALDWAARCPAAGVAFMIDVYARRIVGWRVSRTANAYFVLDALNQALAAIEEAGGRPGLAPARPGLCDPAYCAAFAAAAAAPSPFTWRSNHSTISASVCSTDSRPR